MPSSRGYSLVGKSSCVVKNISIVDVFTKRGQL